jgi:hypothetical protein
MKSFKHEIIPTVKILEKISILPFTSNFFSESQNAGNEENEVEIINSQLQNASSSETASSLQEDTTALEETSVDDGEFYWNYHPYSRHRVLNS